MNEFIGLIQIALAGLQLALNSTKRTDMEQQINLHGFIQLGQAISALEYALTETIAYQKENSISGSNEKLATLWMNVSDCFKCIQKGTEMVDIAFEKQLHWTDPNHTFDASEIHLQRISINNVLKQLRIFRKTYEKLQNKLNGLN